MMQNTSNNKGLSYQYYQLVVLVRQYCIILVREQIKSVPYCKSFPQSSEVQLSVFCVLIDDSIHSIHSFIHHSSELLTVCTVVRVSSIGRTFLPANSSLKTHNNNSPQYSRDNKRLSHKVHGSIRRRHFVAILTSGTTNTSKAFFLLSI